MSDFIYFLECGHKQFYHKRVKLKEGNKRWCNRCRGYKKVTKILVEQYRQPKILTFL